jgi:hypothetical protein
VWCSALELNCATSFCNLLCHEIGLVSMLSIFHPDFLENHYWCNLMESLSPHVVREWQGL